MSDLDVRIDNLLNNIEQAKKGHDSACVAWIEKASREEAKKREVLENLKYAREAGYSNLEDIEADAEDIISRLDATIAEMKSSPMHERGLVVLKEREKAAEAKRKPRSTPKQEAAAKKAYHKLFETGIKQRDRWEGDFIANPAGNAYKTRDGEFIRETLIEGGYMPIWEVVSRRAQSWLAKAGVKTKKQRDEYLAEQKISFRTYLIKVARQVMSENKINPDHLGTKIISDIVAEVIANRSKFQRAQQKKREEKKEERIVKEQFNGDMGAYTEGEKVPDEPTKEDLELLAEMGAKEAA